MQDFMTLARRRESCRRYADRPVEKEKLIALIEAARLSPSACNSQPWSFWVVNSPSRSCPGGQMPAGSADEPLTDECPAFIIVAEEPARLISRIRDAVPSEQVYAQVDIGLAAAISACRRRTAALPPVSWAGLIPRRFAWRRIYPEDKPHPAGDRRGLRGGGGPCRKGPQAAGSDAALSG